MVVTIFRSRLRADAPDYPSVAQKMLDLAREMPGFVSFKTFHNPDGERCSIVEFADWQSHNNWAAHPHHRQAQQQGRNDFYSEYSITVAEVARSSNFHDDE